MPGFNPQQVANRVQNGNAVLIQLGDQTIMFAQSVGAQLPMGTQQLYGIGTSKPQEIQQLLMSPQFSLEKFSFTEVGITVLQGGVDLNLILAGNQFTMTVLDGETNAPKFIYVGCKCQNFNETIAANAPIRDSYTFLAMDVLNADGESIMDTGENALETAVAAGSVALTGLGVGASISVGADGVQISGSVTI